MKKLIRKWLWLDVQEVALSQHFKLIKDLEEKVKKLENNLWEVREAENYARHTWARIKGLEDYFGLEVYKEQIPDPSRIVETPVIDIYKYKKFKKYPPVSK